MRQIQLVTDKFSVNTHLGSYNLTKILFKKTTNTNFAFYKNLCTLAGQKTGQIFLYPGRKLKPMLPCENMCFCLYFHSQIWPSKLFICSFFPKVLCAYFFNKKGFMCLGIMCPLKMSVQIFWDPFFYEILTFGCYKKKIGK